MTNTLAYFDPIHHAPRVQATTLFAAADDGLAPPRSRFRTHV